MDPSKDGKKKKGGRMRTVTFSSKDATTDTKYLQGVKKLEEAFGTRGGYVIGEGALNKNDALYMMEEEEKKRQAVQQRKEAEAAQFKKMVARERALNDVDDIREGENNDSDGNDGNNGEMCGARGRRETRTGGDVELVADGVRRPLGKKRRKTAKELLRVKKVDGEGKPESERTEELGKLAGDGNGEERRAGSDDDEGEPDGLTSLFGGYDDSE